MIVFQHNVFRSLRRYKPWSSATKTRKGAWSVNRYKHLQEAIDNQIKQGHFHFIVDTTDPRRATRQP